MNVKLASGLLYSGRLESIDGFMNVALSSATEHYESNNNKLLNKFNSDVFLRGTQVMYISEQKYRLISSNGLICRNEQVGLT